MIFRSFHFLTGMAVLAAASSFIYASQIDRIKGVSFSPSSTTAETTVLESSVNPGPSSSGSALDGTRSTETDERITRSERHFNVGRQLYFQGSLVGARREFDAAVDALMNAPDNLPDRRRIERRLDEISDLIYRFDIEKLGAGAGVEDAVVFDKAPIDEISNMTFAVDPSLAPKLKTELTQTSSGIPLDLTDPVLSFVHYFSSDRGRQILLAGYRRSGRYKALIQRVFAEEGVPQELIYLAQAESGFLPRAVSNKQAVGMWQFIYGTGSRYDLVRTANLDERLDPEKATHAAAKYLKDLYGRYGDWYLAMAAYNCGEGNVDRAVERTGYSDYWELLKRHALPKETASYVPIIVAMTIMAKNPKDYGLENIELDPAVEFEDIQLTAPTNLNLIADASLQPLSALRDLNPALLSMVVPSGFRVHVPKGAGPTTIAALEAVPAGSRNAWRLHHVEAGDTIAAIAQSYHVAPDRIAAVNRSADSLEAGDMLMIPASYHEPLQALVHRGRFARMGKATAAPVRSSKASIGQRGTRMVASRHMAAPLLHRKAAIRTASIAR